MELSDGTDVEIQTSDGAGLVTFFANPDTTYTFTFSKTGYIILSTSLRPTTSEIYSIILDQTTQTITPSISAGIYYQFSPTNTVLNNLTSYDFMFNLTSSVWNITGCTFSLWNSSTNRLTDSTSTFNGSKCDITINYNTFNYTRYILIASYQLNGTYNDSYQINYKIISNYQGQYSLKTFIDDINSFTDAGFNEATKAIIGFLLIFGIVAYLSYKGIIGITDEVTVLIIIILTVLVSSFGWFTINIGTFPERFPTLSKYIVATLIGLLGIAYIIDKETSVR